MLLLYVSDISSSSLAPLISALDVEPEVAYREKCPGSPLRKGSVKTNNLE